MLSDRRQRVLAALIEEYVSYALPVGSRTLTERYHLGVSPATVRNELSALESDGYISQPHTSAGRIPTDFGYRAFVDDLLENGLEDQAESQAVAEQMRLHATELDSLMEQTTATLARLTDCLSIVMAPSIAEFRVKQVTLISLADSRILLVVVTEDGQVFNRQIEILGSVGAEDVAVIQGILNDALVGHTLQDLEKGLSAGLAEAFRIPLVRVLLEEAIACLRSQSQQGSAAHGHRFGLSGLLAQPEFSTSQSLMPLMQVLEDDAVLLELLEHAKDGAEIPSVFIGRENEAEGLQGVSVVASKYGRGAHAGVVAVIGPTRMNYSKVLKAVQAATLALGDE